MMIEEKIAHSILHQQRDIISKRLLEIHEIIHENHTRESLIINNEYSPNNGESGVYVRLEYSHKSRSWSLEYGKALDKPWRYWAGHGFLPYDESDLDELAYELVENCMTDVVEEYEQEYC